jgi:hypothetical protein
VPPRPAMYELDPHVSRKQLHVHEIDLARSF